MFLQACQTALRRAHQIMHRRVGGAHLGEHLLGRHTAVHQPHASRLAVLLLNAFRRTSPLVGRTLHPSNWRITMTTPAHAPRVNATASQRMMMERQRIEFMASPRASPNGDILWLTNLSCNRSVK